MPSNLMHKKFYIQAIKFLVTLALLSLALRMVDIPDLLSVLQTVDYKILLLGFGLFILRTYLRSWRWKKLLTPYAPELSIWQCFVYSMISSSTALLLPGGIGNDLTRGVILYQYIKASMQAVTTVIVDRIVGIITMILVATIAALLLLQSDMLPVEYMPILWLVVLLFISMLGGCGMLILLTSSVCRPIQGKARKYWNIAYATAEQIRSLLRNHSMLFDILGLSFLAHIAGIAAVLCVDQAFGMGMSLLLLAIAVPVIWILTMIPISINGYGLREWLFILAYQMAGLPSDRALAIGLTITLMHLLHGALGALFVYGMKRPEHVH
jgi:uncharacterized protein (TIRG00374 family)